MIELLKDFLDPCDNKSIESVHQVQESLYGVYSPPSLKQLISLRHLLISTGSLNDVQSEKLLGLSKIECKMLLKKLNSIYHSQRRNHSLNEVNNIENIGG